MFGYALRSKAEDEAYRAGFVQESEKRFNELEELYKNHIRVLEQTLATQKSIIAKQKTVIEMQKIAIKCLENENEELKKFSEASNEDEFE